MSSQVCSPLGINAGGAVCFFDRQWKLNGDGEITGDLWEWRSADNAHRARRAPQPLIMIPGTEVFLGLGFHNSRGLCANRTHIHG